MRNLKKKLLVDLFAGAGGLSCGLEMAGFSPIMANEIDPNYAGVPGQNCAMR
jgi:DNA (cytosine-5)-methyltransferase 1